MDKREVVQGKVTSIVALTLVLTTLVVTPYQNFEPINIPKMVILAVGTTAASFLFGTSIFSSGFLKKPSAKLGIVSFVLLVVSSVLNSDMPLSFQFWGVYGRSTGILTLCMLILFFIVVSQITAENYFYFVRAFLFTGFVTVLYGYLQYFGSDPFSWSSSQTFATFGNINFSSTFWGIFSSFCMFSICIRGVSLPTKYLLLFLGSASIFLIWQSGSLQGLLYLALSSGIGISFLLYRVTKAKILLISGLLSAYGGTAVVFLGTLGIGPLGAVMVQETMLFRSDYWRTAIYMIRDNFFTGVGIEQYGYFYREFRDELAANRTDLNRVSNVAHNIFLDFAAGAGVIFALLLLLFVICIFVYSCRWLQNSKLSSLSIFCFMMWNVFLLYCIISINNIAVTIWFMLFAGMIVRNGLLLSSPSPIKDISLDGEQVFQQLFTKKSRANRDQISPSAFIKLCLGFVLGFAVSSPPAITDALFLSSWNSQDFSRMKQYAFSDFGNTYLAERYLERLTQTQDAAMILEAAREVVNRNPRSVYGWEVIAGLRVTPSAERENAIKILESIDPWGYTQDKP